MCRNLQGMSRRARGMCRRYPRRVPALPFITPEICFRKYSFFLSIIIIIFKP
jgi:hypothetical protein